MKSIVVCLRDIKADTFLTPTLERNYETAKRSLENGISDKKSLLFSHASDFDLWEIGVFCSDSGIIVPTVPLKFICSVSSLVVKGD